MAVNLSPFAGAGWQFFDNDGVILSGGLLYTYAAGTTTPLATYSGASGIFPNSNPFALDSAGRVIGEIWLTSNLSYKFVLKTSLGVTIGTYDNISSVPASVTTDFALKGANTDITSLNAPALGAATATTQAAGNNSTKVATTAFVQASNPQLFPITASVGGNALTINLAATYLDFRSGTLTTGTVTRVATSALSITVPYLATLGSVSTVALRVGVAVAYNNGTPVLCVVNGTVDESALYSPTTINAASNTIGTVYSASTVSASSPMRLIGYVTVPNTTAGTYAAITQVQSYGGVLNPSMLGVGQTWLDSTTPVPIYRALGTTYYNTTGRPISISVYLASASGTLSSLYVGAVLLSTFQNNNGSAMYGQLSAIVPPGQSYVASNGGATLYAWAELR